VTLFVLAALLCAAPAKRDKPERPAIKNVEGNGDAVVTRSKDGGRPLVVKREKPLAKQVEEGLREAGTRIGEEARRAGTRIGEEARKAGDAIGKLVRRLR
jgi:hypothetical protein